MGELFSALGGAAHAKATRNIETSDFTSVWVVFAASHVYAFANVFTSTFIGENFVIEIYHVKLAIIRH